MRALLLCFVPLLLLPGLSAAEDSNHHELTPTVSFYTGDALRTTTIGGFQYSYRFNSLYWMGADGLFGTLSVDKGNGVGLKDGDRFFAADGAFYMNLPSLVAVITPEDKGLGADLYTSIGVGNFWLGDKKEIYGFLGGGMLLYTKIPWLAVRFDLKGIFFKLKNSAGTSFNSDMLLSIGPSLML